MIRFKRFLQITREGDKDMETMHLWLSILCEISILLFEFVGVIILIIVGIKGIYNFIRKDTHTKLELLKGMAFALEFMMGGEILRTVIATGWQTITIVGGIILLRVALTFLIHWEIKSEEKEFETLENRDKE